MKFKLLGLALSIAFSATSIKASAQKAFTEGSINYTVTAMGTAKDTKLYFKADSSAMTGTQGPATFRVIIAKDGDYAANVLDVPIANIKKAFIATPAELEQAKDMEPQLTFTQTTETKVINGFNCKKVNVKDAKGGSYEAWVTGDVSIPKNLLTQYYAAAGGFPIQFTTFQMGQPIAIVVKSVVAEKAPAGTFSIPAGYERGTFTDMMSMMRGGGRQ